ncbi:MAG: InlB B-repeat-containing protein [Eubacteriaceae bacterium]|nr:InlB B-repeat-containing protein [Eubacteriaceae bacterium]
METKTGSRIKIVLAVIFSVILTFTMMPMSVLTVYADTGDGQPQKAAETKTEDVVINETNFPDANFRSIVEGIAGNKTTLTATKISETTTIYCSDKKISNLKGIEYFTALTKLECYNNQLTSLDVSKNTALTVLKCGKNQLTSLDVSSNTVLETLSCYNNQLTNLDVGSNTKLTYLDCDSNQLTSLDVSSNVALTKLYCYSNQLTSLDVSKNTALTDLSCESNQLTSLDVSSNVALTKLWCYGNPLMSLDVSKNTALEILGCWSNQLTSLDVSKNTDLTALLCGVNQLTSLDVSKNTALATLYCNGNQLTSLDVSSNTALKYLWCNGNDLTSLDVSKNTDLIYLMCDSNQLTSLDLSKNTKLISSYSTISPQNLVLKARYTGGKYVVDLKKNDPNIDLSKVSNVSSTGGTYDSTAGTITFDSIPVDDVTYNYDTNNTAKPTMNVSATIKEGFMVTYDGNGMSSGAAPSDNSMYISTDDITAPGNTGNLAKTGYTFSGWSTKADGTGTTYNAGSTFTIDKDTTLYAKWTKKDTLVKPVAPKSVKAKTKDRYSVKVSWKKSTGATSYKVYKATKKTGKYKLVGTVKGTSKTVKKLKANKKYWFKVRAINKAGHATSKAVYAKTKKEPVSFTVKNTKGNNVKVHWKTVKGANGYQVANNHTANGKMKTYWTGKNSNNIYTSMHNTIGKIYKFKMRYYKVKNGKKVYSDWTKAKAITIK